MRVLLQRVSQAEVRVAGETLGHIGRGYVALVGVARNDTPAETAWLAAKVADLRLFEDRAGKMNRSLAEVGGAVLVISQFTLYAETGKGRRPSFSAAARPEQAEPLVEAFCDELRGRGLTVAGGRFGADMLVEIHNDGPVTILLER
ncbi:MAG: D-aminoacyl-tRNA deacylase [Candidatus Promineifilaceae bacterium]